MSTLENLKAAFAGESQANRKYLAFAKKAADEGFPQVAKLFRAVAEAETIHAHAHLRVMSGVGDTAQICRRPSMVKAMSSRRCTRNFSPRPRTRRTSPRYSHSRTPWRPRKCTMVSTPRPLRQSTAGRTFLRGKSSSALCAGTRLTMNCRTSARSAGYREASFSR